MLSARPLALNDEPYQADLRTPGRALKNRQENMHRGLMTVNGKGKALLTPRRPMTVQSHKVFSNTVKPSIKVFRPLGDKTPFPNQKINSIPFETPAPKTAKLAKLMLADPATSITPAALLRPSSARKTSRSPRLSTKPLEFKTPVTQGNHWDVSEEDLEFGNEVDTEGKEEVQEEDYDEIEYMPPTAIIPSYEPSFDMPDYKVAGKMLMGLAHSSKFDDTADLYYAAGIETQIDMKELWQSSGFVSSPSKWESLELPELEDEDLFGNGRQPAKASMLSSGTNTASSSRPTSSQARLRSKSVMNHTSTIPARPTASTVSTSKTFGSKPIVRSTSTRAASTSATTATAQATTTAGITAGTMSLTQKASQPRPATSTGTTTTILGHRRTATTIATTTTRSIGLSRTTSTVSKAVKPSNAKMPAPLTRAASTGRGTAGLARNLSMKTPASAASSKTKTKDSDKDSDLVIAFDKLPVGEEDFLFDI